jgi:hypothetical protein
MREGSISGKEDMFHDIEEMDRRNAGILTAVKRIAIINVAEVLEYSASNEENLVSLAEMYAVSVEDVKQALTEPLPQRTQQDRAMTRFSSVTQGNDTDTKA